MSLRTFDAEAVRVRLPMDRCIDLMAEVQAALSDGRIRLPERTFLPLSSDPDSLLLMPGELTDPPVFGAKLLSIFPENAERGRPSIQGLVVLFAGETGEPLAILDAASLTAIRTAAASAAATRVLARPDAHRLALLGSGVQAASHLEAMAAVRALSEVRIWSRKRSRAEAFAARFARPDLPIHVTADPREAVSGADIVCTVTASITPVLQGRWLSPGCHVNLVGAHTASSREADAEVLARSRLFTEITEFALAEAGDILLAIAEGRIDRSHIVGEIGQVILGRIPGRTTDRELTVYKSLGNTAQDLIAAHHVWMSG